MNAQENIEVPQMPPVKGTGHLIHIVGWGILICSPLFFTGRSGVNSVEDYVRGIIVPLSFMSIFYINYVWLIKRFLFRRQTGRFLCCNVLLILAVMGLVHLCMTYAIPDQMIGPPHAHPRPLRDVIGFYLINVMIYSLVAGLSVAIRMTNGWYKVQANQRELERERAEAELSNLKSQLNPHFLFNTLNNIYSLIAFSPEKAQEAVHDLSRLLRYVLYESNQPLVPIEKDLDFLRNYIELMRIRLPRQVNLQTDIEVATPGLMIAPLLFISLVENAFKHGVSNSQPSFIQISIRQEGDAVSCSIRNSYFPKSAGDKSGSGIGLSNLEKRLSLLYPDCHHFTHDKEDESYVANLVIHKIKQDDVRNH